MVSITKQNKEENNEKQKQKQNFILVLINNPMYNLCKKSKFDEEI